MQLVDSSMIRSLKAKEHFIKHIKIIEEVDLILEIILVILTAAFLLSPALIVWTYHKKGKVPISIACALSIVLFMLDGMKLRCLLIWLICAVLALTMRRDY